MIQRDKVLHRLAPNGKIAALRGQHHNRGPSQSVVVRGHGVVVRTGGAYGNVVTAACVYGQLDSRLNNVTRLTASPGKVVNGGDTATVKVGNDAEVTLNTVENPVAPEATVSVTVVKEWHDQNNANHHRPANLRVTLSNGQSYILNEANGWTVTVDDLPAELDGEPIVYTWTEQAVPGYVHTETRVEGDTTILVNEYREIVLPTLPGHRNAGRRPIVLEEYETPLGIEVMINHVGDCYE